MSRPSLARRFVSMLNHRRESFFNQSLTTSH